MAKTTYLERQMAEVKDLLNEVLSNRSSMKATTAGEEVESSKRNLKTNAGAVKGKAHISLSRQKEGLQPKENYQGRALAEDKDCSASSTSDG